jgi:hypothetical protein
MVTVKMCKDFARQKNWLLHHDNVPSDTFFFAREFLTKNSMTVIPHPPCLPDLALIEDKTEMPPF